VLLLLLALCRTQLLCSMRVPCGRLLPTCVLTLLLLNGPMCLLELHSCMLLVCRKLVRNAATASSLHPCCTC
jgi:hypothetical protein